MRTITRRLLPVGVAVLISTALFLFWPPLIREMSVGVRAAYACALVAVTSYCCRSWFSIAPGARWRMFIIAGVAGHFVAVLAYIGNELLRANGIERIANSIDGLGVRFFFIVGAYPLRFGGFLVGVVTAVALVLLQRLQQQERYVRPI